MKQILYLLFGAVLFVAASNVGSADLSMVYSDPEGNTIVLNADVCRNPRILQYIPEAYRPLFMEGFAKLLGAHYLMCWAISTDGAQITILYEDGDAGRLPAYIFSPGAGA